MSEDDERAWNLAIYKVWMTDEERDQFAPFFLTVLVILGIFVFIGWAVWKYLL